LTGALSNPRDYIILARVCGPRGGGPVCGPAWRRTRTQQRTRAPQQTAASFDQLVGAAEQCPL